MFSDKLRTQFAGLDMRTPISIAPAGSEGTGPAHAEHVANRLLEYVERGASKVAIQYTCSEDLCDYPTGKEGLGRWALATDSSALSKDFHYFVALGDEQACMGRRDVGLKAIDLLKKQVPEGVIVEANIVGRRMDPEASDSWAQMAKDFESAGADVIELDVSCPDFAAHVDPRWGALVREPGFPAQQIADDEETLTELCMTVNKAIKIPFGWKMSPETGWPRFLYIAKASLEAGARWVSVTNCPLVLTPIDIHNDGGPDTDAFPFGTANFLGGASGYGRAMGRKATAAIKTWVPDIEVIGITGITKPEYAVEYVMLGAQIAELASGLFFNGPQFIDRCVKFFDRFLDQHDYESVDAIRGRALAHTDWDGASFDFMYGQLASRIDKDLCTGCKRCGGHVCFAIGHDEDGKAEVNEVKCSGCGLCELVCDSGAAKLYKRDVPKVLDLANNVPSDPEWVKWGGQSR